MSLQQLEQKYDYYPDSHSFAFSFFNLLLQPFLRIRCPRMQVLPTKSTHEIPSGIGVHDVPGSMTATVIGAFMLFVFKSRRSPGTTERPARSYLP